MIVQYIEQRIYQHFFIENFKDLKETEDKKIKKPASK